MKLVVSFVLFYLLSGCSTTPQTETYDLSQRAGVYILGYTSLPELRRAMEDQLVEDLAKRDMLGFASHIDFPDLQSTTRATLLDAANAKSALAVLVINQVVPGEDGIIDNPLRITPDHPDLKSFYAFARRTERNYVPGREVFAEVNAFLIQEDTAKLVWSGTTWSFQADGKGGAISGMSANIATELGDIKRALRGGAD